MDNRLIVALDARDAEAAKGFIEDEADPARVLAMYHGALSHLYWSNKDIVSLVAVGRNALAFGAALTDEAHLGLLKSIAYDIGSFCWPGWDEAGIELDDQTLAFGAQAAAFNLELAQRLRRPVLPLANAYWLIGAYELARGERKDAARSFDHARALSVDAAEIPTELLMLGYIAIARGSCVDTEPFASVEDGPALVAQLETAARVFAH